MEKIKEFFFKMMLAGWASGHTPQPILGLPGFEGFLLSDKELTLIDAWTTNRETRYSFGFTTIRSQEPLWAMSYSGYYPKYPKELTQLVKDAIHTAYSERVFYGGRGLEQLHAYDGRFHYHNRSKGSFRSFAGRETVTERGKGVVGWHDYRGGILMNK